ncbi:MAG: PKD domain-containing protein, partial [Chloroflexota bacterium]
TTSLAWGDWDNDGDLDLAVGNDGGDRDQVYANLGSTPGSPKFAWVWQSNSSNNTQDVAWADADGDGDLDLAVAGANGGYYRNGYVMPAHAGVANMLLPLNSSYLSIQRPITTGGQIWYRPTLSNPSSLVIPVEFTVYDPDGRYQHGTRNNLNDVAGEYAVTSTVQYSVRGTHWQTANGSGPTYNPGTQRYTFNWRAGTDLNNASNAASDDVRLRVTISHINKNGLVQRAKTSAVSPPFRVRNLECVWPEDASITYQPPSPIIPGQPVTFTGNVIGGGNGIFGQITYNWDFGNGVISQGVIIYHTFAPTSTPVVSLTVTGAPCPVTRPDFVATTLTLAQSQPISGGIYLPIILKSSVGAGAVEEVPTEGIITFGQMPGNAGLTQITGLFGTIEAGGTALQWDAGPPDDNILGYRIYRANVGTIGFTLLADVPANITTYTDATATCGKTYFVTSYNSAGESLPSTASYFSPPCQ